MFKSGYLAKVGGAAATAASLVLAVAGTANAQVGAGWVGWGQTNNTHAVWCVQKLIDDSPAPASTIPDGQFGQHTYDAIVAFQKWAGLPVDGTVGPRTGDALLTRFQDYYDNYCYGYLPTTY